MSEVRAFRAASLREALAIVRRELGEDAVILTTRQVTRRRLLPWWRSRTEFEVIAGIANETEADAGGRSTPAASFPRSTASPTRSRATADAPAQHRGTQTPPGRLLDSGIPLDAPVVTARPAPAERTVSHRPDGVRRTDVRITDASENLDAPPATEQHLSGSAAAPDATPPRPPRPENHPPAEDPLARRLSSIEQMLAALTQARAADPSTAIPEELFELYTALLDNDVDDQLASELIVHLRQHCRPALWSDRQAVNAELIRCVEPMFRCQGPIVPVPGQRKVVALVGPTGVGKTTTIAKLAANFRLRDRIRMGLVTVDTYRIAAVEQLRTYAEIIDLPMAVVTSPREMRRAIQEFESMDLVLIDTAGRSPRDELQIKELRSLLAEADVDEVHLVLSLTASARTIAATAERFAEAPTTALVLTKLDEVSGLGTLLTVARTVDLPISYLTTGQDVPDDIEVASAGRMSRLVLGLEPVHSRTL